MPATREKDGIVYFKEPHRIRFTIWLHHHLDCDSLIKPEESYSETISVLCYAKSKEYNSALQGVRKTVFPEALVLGGISSYEV